MMRWLDIFLSYRIYSETIRVLQKHLKQQMLCAQCSALCGLSRNLGKTNKTYLNNNLQYIYIQKPNIADFSIWE
jgi:hypothetical protein